MWKENPQKGSFKMELFNMNMELMELLEKINNKLDCIVSQSYGNNYYYNCALNYGSDSCANVNFGTDADVAYEYEDEDKDEAEEDQ